MGRKRMSRSPPTPLLEEATPQPSQPSGSLQPTLSKLPPPYLGPTPHSATPAAPPEHSQTVIVPPFDDDWIEFMHWIFRMRLALQLRGSWDVVDGSYPEPDRRVDPDSHADWFARDLDAQLQIAMNLKGEAMNRVIFCKTAKECWDKLTSRYQGKPVDLMSELYRSNLNDSEPMEPQINRILLAAQSLDTLGSPIPEVHLAFQLIHALPDSMEVLKCMLYQVPLADMNTDHVMMMILDDERRRVRASGKSATAFSSKASRKGSGKEKEKDIVS